MISLEFRLILEERRQEWEQRLAHAKEQGVGSHKLNVIEEVIKAYALVLADEETKS